MTERGRIAAEHRDRRAGVIEQRPQKPISKTKREKPWIVMWRWGSRKPHVFGRYATREIAERVIAVRNGPFLQRESDGARFEMGYRLYLVSPDEAANR